jgi:hypothetical protein
MPPCDEVPVEIPDELEGLLEELVLLTLEPALLLEGSVVLVYVRDGDGEEEPLRR